MILDYDSIKRVDIGVSKSRWGNHFTHVWIEQFDIGVNTWITNFAKLQGKARTTKEKVEKVKGKELEEENVKPKRKKICMLLYSFRVQYH